MLRKAENSERMKTAGEWNAGIPSPPVTFKVSFAILCYNQERYIRAAVESALSQDFSPLEIVISDDASPDRTFDIVKEIVHNYRGPHQIVLNQNEQNLGIAGNVNKIWAISSGDFVVFQAGDDISKPHRTRKLVAEWESKERHPDLISSSAECIDADGAPTGDLLQQPVTAPSVDNIVIRGIAYNISGCVNAYARRVHATAGPLNNRVVYEDRAYTFRALLGGGISIVPEPLLLYRVHTGSVMTEIYRESARRLKGLGIRQLSADLGTWTDHQQSLAAHNAGTRHARMKLSRMIVSQKILTEFVQATFLKRACLLCKALFSGRLRASWIMLNAFLN